MRKIIGIALTGIVAATSVALVAGPAQAKSGNHVTINTITTKTTPSAAAGSLAKVRPSVSKTGHVRITSKLLTVQAGSKILIDKAKSASLPGGTYTVTTYVKYKTYKVGKGGDLVFKAKHSKKKTQTLVVNRRCATLADFNSVNVAEDDGGEGTVTLAALSGDPESVVAAKLHSNGVLVFSQSAESAPTGRISPQLVEESSTISGRIYPRCDDEDPFFVVFGDGITIYKNEYYWD